MMLLKGSGLAVPLFFVAGGLLLSPRESHAQCRTGAAAPNGGRNLSTQRFPQNIQIQQQAGLLFGRQQQPQQQMGLLMGRQQSQQQMGLLMGFQQQQQQAYLIALQQQQATMQALQQLQQQNALLNAALQLQLQQNGQLRAAAIPIK